MRVQAATLSSRAPDRPGLYLPADTIAVALVWVTMASSSVVFFEPAPFDAMALVLIAFLPVIGVVQVPPSLRLLLGAWLVISACGLLPIFYAQETARALKHTGVTLYLALLAIVLAGFVATHPERHGRIIMSGYAVAAVICTLAAIGGFLNLVPGAELFTEFDRGRGTFKDPNVYGAFLPPAILYALYNMMTRPPARAIFWLLLVPPLMYGALISYSRGAWANLALGLAAFGYLTLVTAPTVRRQFGFLVLGVLAIGVMAGVLIVAAQFRETAELLSHRASFIQDYDLGSGGRFAGQLKALGVILEHPFGIGAREFGFHYHTGDVHNVYLSMFLNAGWVGGGLYLAIVIVTLVAGFIHAVQRTTARGLFIAVYAAFVGAAGEGMVIDTDHWRHYFVLLAVTWGMMTARASLQPMPIQSAPRKTSGPGGPAPS